MDDNRDDKRVCAWSGEEFTGKAYILQTTDGVELVSEAALKGRAAQPDDQADAAPADLTKPPAA